MTVPSEQSRIQYETDGTSVFFPVPFRFIEDQHLRVTLLHAGVETVLVLGADYSVSGANDPAGGSITTTTAYPPGDELTIERIVPITQETAYQRNDPFPERAHEQALDKLTMICQQIANWFGWGSAALSRVLMLGRFDVSGSGAYRANGNRITSLGDPQTDTDAVNRRSMRDYVELMVAGVVGGYGTFVQNGIAAIVRTFQGKQREVVSVTDYIGADPTGAADSTVAIDAALAVTAAPYIPDGIYTYAGDIDALFARKPFGPGSIRYDGYDYKVQRQPVENALWAGDFVSWLMGHALSVNTAQRVQIPAGVTHAREGLKADTTIYHVDGAQSENAMRIQRRAGTSDAAPHVMVLNLSMIETNPLRGRRCVLEINGLRSANYTGGPIELRVQASREPEQPILRADGQYSNGNEVISTTAIDLKTESRPRSAPYYVVVDVPPEAVQIAAVLSVGFAGAAPDDDFVEIEWIRIYPGECVETTQEITPQQQHNHAASRYQTSYPYGVPRGAPTRQGAVSAVAVTTAANWALSIPIRFDVPMVVPPQFIFQQPLSGTESRLLDVNDNTFISGVAFDLSERGAVITNNQPTTIGHRYLCQWTATAIF